MNAGSSTVELVKLTLCGPTDVAKEMALAAEALALFAQWQQDGYQP
jgi:hypothetical protein